LLRADANCSSPLAPAYFNFSSENALAQTTSVRARTRIGVGFGNPREGNFVLPSWQIFSADVR